MKHYVEMKFDPVKFDLQLLPRIRGALDQAQAQIEGFTQYELLQAKDWSIKKPEMLLVLEFAGIDSLDTYLKHPLHMQLLQTLKPYLAEKAVFDGLI